MTAPRILEIGMHFHPAGGGVDRYFSGLVHALQVMERDVTAAALGTPGPGFRAAHSLGPEEAGLARRLLAIRRLGPSLALPGTIAATHFALYALPLVSRLRGLPHVVHFHGPWATESAREGQGRLVTALKRLIERRVYSSARRLIALSSAFGDILHRDYGIPQERIRIVPGGVDIARFRPAGERSAIRTRLGWPTEKKIIFCIRRLVRRMGLENLLEAFAQVSTRHPDTQLVIAGRGPLMEELRARTTALGLDAKVRFTGFVADDALPDFYTAADFTMVPSESLEGFGLVVLESLACGTPALVTPVGGLPETVDGLDPRLVLTGYATADLAHGLERGLSAPLPHSATCRAFVGDRFSWPVIARRILDVYEEASHDSLC